MAESNGLLDLMKSPAAMGLLAAGFGGLAGAGRNTPFNNLGRAGLAGLAGYSAADSLQQKQYKIDEQKRIQELIPTFYKTGEDGSTTFDGVGAARAGIDPKLINDYSAVPNAGRAKVARTMEVPTLNGGKQTIQMDEYGGQVGEARDAYITPQMVDTGGTKQFVTPVAGQSFAVGMSPAQVLADQNSKANIGLRSEANRIAGDANNIMAGLKQQEQQLKVDDLTAKQSEQKRALAAQQSAINAQLGVIDKALTHPGRETVTGMSGVLNPTNYMRGTDARDFQVVNDQLQGAAFLQAFESLKGGGQITEVEGKKATDAMARLNTAQSDGEYKKALEELRGIMAQGQSRLSGAPMQGGNLTSEQSPPANPQRIRFDAQGNIIQ